MVRLEAHGRHGSGGRLVVLPRVAHRLQHVCRRHLGRTGEDAVEEAEARHELALRIVGVHAVPVGAAADLTEQVEPTDRANLQVEDRRDRRVPREPLTSEGLGQTLLGEEVELLGTVVPIALEACAERDPVAELMHQVGRSLPAESVARDVVVASRAHPTAEPEARLAPQVVGVVVEAEREARCDGRDGGSALAGRGARERDRHADIDVDPVAILREPRVLARLVQLVPEHVHLLAEVAEIALDDGDPVRELPHVLLFEEPLIARHADDHACILEGGADHIAPLELAILVDRRILLRLAGLRPGLVEHADLHHEGRLAGPLGEHPAHLLGRHRQPRHGAVGAGAVSARGHEARVERRLLQILGILLQVRQLGEERAARHAGAGVSRESADRGTLVDGTATTLPGLAFRDLAQAAGLGHLLWRLDLGGRGRGDACHRGGRRRGGGGHADTRGPTEHPLGLDRGGRGRGGFRRIRLGNSHGGLSAGRVGRAEGGGRHDSGQNKRNNQSVLLHGVLLDYSSVS